MNFFDETSFLEAQSTDFFTEFLGARGEGGTVTMHCTGREWFDEFKYATPKIHGTGQEVSPTKAMRASRRPVKRSFVRAMRRLQNTGFCVYRGQVHVQPLNQMPAAAVTKTQPVSMIKQASGPRLSCITWNCGGFNSESYHEFWYWLTLQQIDICLIQSTRWSLEEPWECGGFVFIPTPRQAAGTHDGLLTVVRAQFCDAASISHATILEGRIQHVRCDLGPISIDLVNCYQHPYNVAKSRPEPLKSRSTFWTAWEDLLQKLPYRNLLITAGDFNCTLDKPKPGPATDVLFPDRDAFQAIIRRFSLASTKIHDKHPTFIGPGGQSNIDYIFARRPQLDQLSRQAKCIRSFPLNSHRDFPDHIPTAGTIPLNWKAWYSQPKACPNRLSRATVQRMSQERDLQSPLWNDFELQIDSTLRQACAMHEPPQVVSNHILTVCNHHFRHTVQNKDTPNQIVAARSIVALKWRHLHLARHSQHRGHPPLMQAFVAWKHMSKHLQLRKRLRAHCQARRRAKLQSVIDEATQAAHRHDSRRLYIYGNSHSHPETAQKADSFSCSWNSSIAAGGTAGLGAALWCYLSCHLLSLSRVACLRTPI